jgi:hypothetical protein
MLLGLLLGLERTHAHKMAGMRTYALVSMGSCMFIIIANEIINSSFRYTGIDPVRMAGAIVTGIGFLCGGLIVFNHERLVGLVGGISSILSFYLHFDWSIALACTLGYASHPVIDGLTVGGVRYLYPHVKKFRLLPKAWCTKTKGTGDITLLFLASISLAIFFSLHGGHLNTKHFSAQLTHCSWAVVYIPEGRRFPKVLLMA